MNLPDSENLAVKVSNLFKRYKNGVEATRGVDFSVSRGESVSILGPNGAGKTTFLRQLTTELLPTSGSVEVFGVDAVKNPMAAKQLMGITPQESGLFETLKVREHLELFGKLKGLSKQEAKLQTDELLADLDLQTQEIKQVGELSGGQRRRILIGLALLGKPPLLILDEPTTGLDPQSRRAIWILLKKNIDDGVTLLFSTHYMEEAEQLSRRIAFINCGNIVADGSLTELRGRFPNKYRLSYANGNGQIPMPRQEFFADFKSAQNYVVEKKIGEYQLSTVSLEDVYFSIVGENLNEGDVKK